MTFSRLRYLTRASSLRVSSSFVPRFFSFRFPVRFFSSAAPNSTTRSSASPDPSTSTPTAASSTSTSSSPSLSISSDGTTSFVPPFSLGPVIFRSTKNLNVFIHGYDHFPSVKSSSPSSPPAGFSPFPNIPLSSTGSVAAANEVGDLTQLIQQIAPSTMVLDLNEYDYAGICADLVNESLITQDEYRAQSSNATIELEGIYHALTLIIAQERMRGLLDKLEYTVLLSIQKEIPLLLADFPFQQFSTLLVEAVEKEGLKIYHIMRIGNLIKCLISLMDRDEWRSAAAELKELFPAVYDMWIERRVQHVFHQFVRCETYGKEAEEEVKAKGKFYVPERPKPVVLVAIARPMFDRFVSLMNKHIQQQERDAEHAKSKTSSLIN